MLARMEAALLIFLDIQLHYIFGAGEQVGNGTRFENSWKVPQIFTAQADKDGKELEHKNVNITKIKFRTCCHTTPYEFQFLINTIYPHHCRY